MVSCQRLWNNMCVQNVKSCNMSGLCACFQQTSLFAFTIKPSQGEGKWEILQEFLRGALSVTSFVLLCHISLASEFSCWDFIGIQQLSEMPLRITANFSCIFFIFPWLPYIMFSKTRRLKSNQIPSTCSWAWRKVIQTGWGEEGENKDKTRRNGRNKRRRRQSWQRMKADRWEERGKRSRTSENLKVTLWFIADSYASQDCAVLSKYDPFEINLLSTTHQENALLIHWKD